MMQFLDLQAQRQRLEPGLQAAIQKVLEHGQFIMGPEVFELESSLARLSGAKHCISVANGTDALMLALMALKLCPGDEVIVPNFSFFATSEAVSHLGLKPVFVDIDPASFNIEPAAVAAAITAKTKAVIAVNLYGRCADYTALNAIGETHGITIIEDAAQSFGATWQGKASCNLATIGCTSFFPSKPLGCYGDGGACFTNDDDLAEKIKMLRVHGQSKRYVHPLIGVNSRLDTLQAAILLQKLTIFSEEIEKREKIGRRYNELLSDVAQTPFIPESDRHAFAQYTLRVPARDHFQQKMAQLGIPTTVHYPVTLSDQPCYKEMKTTVTPHATIAAQAVVSLPMHPYLSTSEQTKIIEAVKTSLGD